MECPLAADAVRKIWAGPGGIAPLAWCVAHSSICKMSTETPENPGEVPIVLPHLQGWAAAHILARTQPTGTQPAQLGHTTGADFTALVNAPETHQGCQLRCNYDQ